MSLVLQELRFVLDNRTIWWGSISRTQLKQIFL